MKGVNLHHPPFIKGVWVVGGAHSAEFSLRFEPCEGKLRFAILACSALVLGARLRLGVIFKGVIVNRDGLLTYISEKKRAHKLKKTPRDTGRVSLGHPAGQTGVYRPVSLGFPVLYSRKTDNFAGTPAGCPWDRPSTGFSENLCDFSYVPFLLPNINVESSPHFRLLASISVLGGRVVGVGAFS